MNILVYSLLFTLIAAGVTFVITPLIRNLAFKIGAVDQPDKRKIHSQPIARLGGLAIFLGAAVSILVLSLVKKEVLSPLIWEKCGRYSLVQRPF
jgi:UDP-GlcNAc:undecaprenyl-phosphate GlcNAc-1-phosphate transferase